MPLSKDSGVRENPKYCNSSAPMAWLYSSLIRFAPRWK